MTKGHKWTRIYTLPTKRAAQKSASSLKKTVKRPVMVRRIKADAYWRRKGQKWRWAVYRMDSKSGGERQEASKIRVQDKRGYSYLRKDTGKPGRTPEDEQWYKPGVKTGWEKGQSQSVRRAKVLKAHKGDELASARSMQALSNVTTDRETARKAGVDADYFYRKYRRQAAVGRRAPRITPKTPRLR